MLPFVAVLLTPRLLACQPVDVFLCRCCYSLATGTPHDRVPDGRGWVFSSYLLPFSQFLYASKSRAAPLSHPNQAAFHAGQKDKQEAAHGVQEFLAAPVLRTGPKVKKKHKAAHD